MIFTAQWGHTNLAIGAGLTPETVTQVVGVGGSEYPFGSWLDEVSEQNPSAGGTNTVPGTTNSAARVWHNHLGSTVADSNGEIQVYLDHFPPSPFLSPATSYNGVSYSEAVAPVLLGDVSLDGIVTFSDISPFIAALSSGSVQAEADCNEDGLVNFSDISPFIAILSGN